MKGMLVFVGLLTILGGLLPILKEKTLLSGILTNVPTEGTGYQVIIIAIGVIAIWYGFHKGKNVK